MLVKQLLVTTIGGLTNMPLWLLFYEVDATMIEPEYWFAVGVEIAAPTLQLAIEQSESEIYEEFNPHHSEVCDIRPIYVERIAIDAITRIEEKPIIKPKNN